MKRVLIALTGLMAVLGGCAPSQTLAPEELANIPRVTQRDLDSLRCIGIRVDGGRLATSVMGQARDYIRDGHVWLAEALFEDAARAGCGLATDSLRVIAECAQKPGHYLAITSKSYRTSDSVIGTLGFWDFSVATGENEYVNSLPRVSHLECRRN